MYKNNPENISRGTDFPFLTLSFVIFFKNMFPYFLFSSPLPSHHSPPPPHTHTHVLLNGNFTLNSVVDIVVSGIIIFLFLRRHKEKLIMWIRTDYIRVILRTNLVMFFKHEVKSSETANFT